jgi:hypothetical protein
MKRTIQTIFILFYLFIIGCSETQNNQKKNAHAMQELGFKLYVSYGFEDNTVLISENVTPEIIKKTMNSIDWNSFHLVWLENNKDSNFVEVGGSLFEDGLSASFNTDDMNYLKEPYPISIEEMTEILITYLHGEKVLRSKYLFK